MLKSYIIEDILFSSKYGIMKGQPKVGEKYDFRRGMITDIDLDQYETGDNVAFGREWRIFMITTPLVKITQKDNDTFYLETKNSIYVLKEWRE